MDARRRALRSAMTLLEVVISIALIAMLVASLFTFYWQALAIRDHAARSAGRSQVVQQMLGVISAELRNAVAMETIQIGNLQQFVGERRKLTFTTSGLPPKSLYAFFRESEERPAPRDDLYEVTYELWIDPDEETESGDPIVGGILRTVRQGLDPYETEEDVPEGEDLLYIRRDLWSYELGYLEFRYFDGVEWSTTWDVTQGNKLPHLIQITIGFDSLTQEALDDEDLTDYPIDQYPLGPDHADPDRYSTMVRIPAADDTYSAHMYRLSTEAEEVYEFGGPGAGEEEGEGL